MIYTLIPLCLIYFVRFKLAQHEIRRLHKVISFHKEQSENLFKKNSRLKKTIDRTKKLL